MDPVPSQKVKFYYYRVPQKPHNNLPKRGSPHLNEVDLYSRHAPNFIPAARGGLTICEVILPNGEIYTGASTCSFADQFCYRIGREIAYGRAMKLVEKYETD